MRRHPIAFKHCVIAMLSLLWLCQSVWAESIWHCSRSDVQIADASDNFTLASLPIEREVIRISLHDLFSVYQGAPIKMNGGLPLSVCVIANSENALTKSALNSIGAQSSALKALAHQTTILKTHIHLVTNESEMLACITKNHPAVGYLSTTTHTEAAGPCF